MDPADDPQRALADALAHADRAQALRDEALQPPEQLPPTVGAMVDVASYVVGFGIGVGGPALLFVLCTLLGDASVAGGAIANVIFWLGAPALAAAGIALGRHMHHAQTQRLLATTTFASAPALTQSSAAGPTPVAVRPGAKP